MFEKASRLKLRVHTTKGVLLIEDLWDLPLKSVSNLSLNSVANSLNTQLKTENEIDFVSEKTTENQKLKLQFDIVLYIIKIKKEEAEKQLAKQHNEIEKQKVIDAIAIKKTKNLGKKSIKELEKELDTFD